MVTESDARHPDGSTAASYAYTPRAFGREIRLTLKDHALEIDDMRSVTLIPLADIEAVRLTFEPRGVMSRCFRTRLRAHGGRTASFASLSARSMVHLDNQREPYRRFLAALLPAVARANPACRFQAGRAAALWAVLAAASVVILGAVIYVVSTGAKHLSPGGVVAAVAVAAVSAWTVVEMVARNRPRNFAPDAPPPDLMP